MNWLLQWQPGLSREVPQAVLLAIGERLYDSLTSKCRLAITRARAKLEKVIVPDSTYGGNIDTWFDNDNLQAEAWNVYVVLPLVGELKVDLRDLEVKLTSLERPSLDDLNEIWARVEEIRDAIAALPSPNFFERMSIDFGGAKRSALIKTFRSAQAWLRTELARNLSQRCLPIIGMAMGENEATQLDVIHEVELETRTPEIADSHPENDQEIPGPGAQFAIMNARGDGVWTTCVQTPSGPGLKIQYQVSGVVFVADDIHLDGILHREDLPYSLALALLDPQTKSKVIARIRDEQYDEM
jgi:hypothetical protein